MSGDKFINDKEIGGLIECELTDMKRENILGLV